MKKIKVKLLLIIGVLVFLAFKFPISSSTPVQLTPIKIGVFTPETSGLTIYSPWIKQGFELGLSYSTNNTNHTINSQPYEITYYDTQGSPTTAVTVLTNAIENDGVSIIVGGASSAVAGAMAPIAESYGKLFFINPASSSSLTEDPLFNKYTFRVGRNTLHDAKASINFAWDTIGARNFSFIAPDYSFGWAGVNALEAEVMARGGNVIKTEYVPLGGFGASDITPFLNQIISADNQNGVDILIIVWAGSYSELFRDMDILNIKSQMNVSMSIIDIFSLNMIESTLIPPTTLINTTGVAVYGYELPNNSVNDWMVQEHIDRNIMPNAGFGLTYRVPELFTASGFATAQFLVSVTNAIPNLDVNNMICHLEGLYLTTPKGPTYMRPEDHQGLAEMYIARVVNDTRIGSETYNQLIAELVNTLSIDSVAPPINTSYIPCAGRFNQVTTTINEEITETITDTSSVTRTTTILTNEGTITVSDFLTETVIKTSEGFGLYLFGLGLLFITIRRRK